MAWFAMASRDAVDLFCSADPCVSTPVEYDEPTMVTGDDCEAGADATRYTVRPLTWVESQRWDGATPAETIDGIVRLALIAIDGDAATAKAARECLHPRVAIPLCVAIQQVTWGNFTSAADD